MKGPPMHDPLLAGWPDDPDPFGPFPPSTRGPTDDLLSQFENAIEHPWDTQLDLNADHTGFWLNEVELRSEVFGSFEAPDEYDPLHPLLDALEESIEGSIGPARPEPLELEEPLNRWPGDGPTSPAPPLPEESAGYGRAAHPEILPPHLSQPLGGRGAGASLGSRSGQAYGDEGELVWCPLQQQMVPQEECEQCEYADGPDDLGRYVCTYDDDDEEAQG